MILILDKKINYIDKKTKKYVNIIVYYIFKKI